ncbi:hypothetical protein ACFLU6_11440, partial [Acidobacteriota bacterium]
EYAMGNLRVTSGKVKYLLPGHNRRMMHFLNASHGLLPAEDVLGRIEQNRLDEIFPLVPGEVKPASDGVMFFPINLAETIPMPARERPVDPLEHKLIALSCGSQSMSSIIALAIKEATDGPDETVRLRCLDFYRAIFSENWALAFAGSWGKGSV